MAIALRAAGSFVGANATSIAVSQPTGTVDNDFMVAIIVDYTSSGTSAVPDGWTFLTSAAGAGCRVQIFWAVKGVSAGLPVATSWTWTGLTAHCAGLIVGYSGANSSGITGTPTARYQMAGQPVGCNGLTTGYDNAMVIGVFVTTNAGGTVTWSNESCATLGALSEANGSSDQGYSYAGYPIYDIAVAAASQSSAGTTGAVTATLSTNCANVCALLALYPAAAPLICPMDQDG